MESIRSKLVKMLLLLLDGPIFSFSFQTSVTNTGCGTTQLCAAQPAGCNPGTGSCTLLGTKKKSDGNFAFVLAGESSGYLAIVLSSDAALVS